MQWIETRVIFNAQQPRIVEELIANLYVELGVQGVIVEDPELRPDEEWGEDAARIPMFHSVGAYFPKRPGYRKTRRALEEGLSRLSAQFDLTYRIVEQTLDEQDWAEAWKAYFWPQRISRRLVVKPSWRSYTPEPEDIVIDIDPGMAFGTGAHPTTALCLRLIERHLRPGQRVLDIGSGSGILMIGAALLGAGKLLGVDKDPVAVEIAESNLLRNQIPPHLFTVQTGNLVQGIAESYDLVTANILSWVILRLLDDIKAVLAPGGCFICSGIIADNQAQVQDKMAAVGFEILEAQTEEKWVAIAGRLRAAA